LATGETFRGLDETRQLANAPQRGEITRQERASHHKRLINEERTKLCWEYVDTGVVTDEWPASENRPAPGTKIALPIVLI
jgi:hypothetical protein